jgi:hypothetical protein
LKNGTNERESLRVGEQIQPPQPIVSTLFSSELGACFQSHSTIWVSIARHGNPRHGTKSGAKLAASLASFGLHLGLHNPFKLCLPSMLFWLLILEVRALQTIADEHGSCILHR